MFANESSRVQPERQDLGAYDYVVAIGPWVNPHGRAQPADGCRNRCAQAAPLPALLADTTLTGPANRRAEGDASLALRTGFVAGHGCGTALRAAAEVARATHEVARVAVAAVAAVTLEDAHRFGDTVVSWNACLPVGAFVAHASADTAELLGEVAVLARAVGLPIGIDFARPRLGPAAADHATRIACVRECHVCNGKREVTSGHGRQGIRGGCIHSRCR